MIPAATTYSFVQLSDIHYDPHYSSTGNEFCHSEQESVQVLQESKRVSAPTKASVKRDNFKYGRPGSECDSPLVLIEKTVAQLHTLDPDIVLWTGDSSRHDRDIKLPRHPLDIIQGIKRVAGLVNSAFRVGTVFPTLGNWDTKVQNDPSLEDYQQLYQIWSILWSEKQKSEIQITFLEGGFYSDNVAGDCRKHNQQLEWLESILEEAQQLGDNVVLIGHVPPMNYLGVPLYHSRCYAAFTNLIGRYHKQIVSQYYGHVNRDITYLTTRENDGSIHLVPLTQQSLSNIILSDYEIIGQLFTGSSVVPYFYPSFRWGQIGSTSNYTNSTTLSILEHVQYYAPIDTYRSYQSGGDFLLKENQTFYKESCTTSALSMNSLTPMDWKSLSASIQHEIKVSGSSQLAKYYWECSTVHWSDSFSSQPASESRTSRGYSSHDHVISDGHNQGGEAGFRLPFDGGCLCDFGQKKLPTLMQSSQNYTISIIPQIENNNIKVYSNETKQILLDEYFPLACKKQNRDLNVCVKGDKIVVSNFGASKIYRVDLQKNVNAFTDLRNEIKDENCVDFCLDHKTDYFITNHQLYEVNIAKQKVKRSLTLKQSLSKMAINSDSTLLALGGTSIDIVDVKSWKVVASLSGHATEIQDLVFGHDGCLYSCAKDDRFISAWTLSDRKSKVFVSESSPLKLSVGKHLMAHLENGMIAFWDKKSSKSPIGIIELSIQDAATYSAFLSSSFAADDRNIFFSFGTNLQPSIEKFTYLSSDEKVKAHVVLTRLLQSTTEKGQKRVKTSNIQRNSAEVQLEEAQQPVMIVQEESLADRVKALQVLEPVETKKATQASLQALLSQAIHASDDQLLEKALAVGDKKVIHATIMRLSPAHILLLLDQIVVRLQKKPNRASQLVEWVRACLLHHSGYLLSVPHLTQRLASLYRTLNTRKEALPKLMQLAGRLDMIVSQMDVVPYQDSDNALVFTADQDASGGEESEEDDEEMYLDEQEGGDNSDDDEDDGFEMDEDYE